MITLRNLIFSLGLALAIAWSGAAPAAVTANNVITLQNPSGGHIQFLQGTDVAGTYKTLYTAGANGSRCQAMWATNNDGSATHLLTVQLVNGGVKYGGVAVTTAFSQGFADGVAPLDFLASKWSGPALNSDGNHTLKLITGDSIQATFATALTSSDVINLVVDCDDF